jgi:hypothetical protein
LSEMQTVSQQTDNGRAIEIIIEKTMWSPCDHHVTPVVSLDDMSFI